MYTAVITKQSVSLQDGIYNITVNCEVSQGGSVVWEATGSGRYNPAVLDLEAPKNAILAELRAKWDKWKAEYGIYNSAGFDSAITDMQGTVNTYINS